MSTHLPCERSIVFLSPYGFAAATSDTEAAVAWSDIGLISENHDEDGSCRPDTFLQSVPNSRSQC